MIFYLLELYIQAIYSFRHGCNLKPRKVLLSKTQDHLFRHKTTQKNSKSKEFLRCHFLGLISDTLCSFKSLLSLIYIIGFYEFVIS